MANQISEIQREIIINKCLKGISVTAIAHLLSLPRITVSNIVNKFLKTGVVKCGLCGGNTRGKFIEQQKEATKRRIDDNCILKLKQLQEKVLLEYNVNLNISTIDRCLQKFHYTLKALVPVPKNFKSSRKPSDNTNITSTPESAATDVKDSRNYQTNKMDNSNIQQADHLLETHTNESKHKPDSNVQKKDHTKKTRITMIETN
ncbi:hypothetical protein A3Q56_06737 [Intoshia linei]|uniref:Paired domain-containing protein n=1 Tax=Intoshia linei TaxID=1819745 RepID=A0A177AWG2_9BILA|nr:hypothetical protein A3Q56_06737 [Intoshia linei]